MNAEAVGKNVVKERNAASRVDPGERNAPTVGFVPFDDERRPFARGGDVASPPRVGAFDVAAEGPRGEVERESVGLRRVERQLDAEETGFGEGTDDVIEHVVRGRGPEQKRNGKRIRRTGLKKVLDNAKNPRIIHFLSRTTTLQAMFFGRARKATMKNFQNRS